MRKWGTVSILGVLCFLLSSCSPLQQGKSQGSSQAESQNEEVDKDIATKISIHSAELVTETAEDKVLEENRNEWINPEGMILQARIKTPKGYTRVPAEVGSFQEYLRNQPMKPDNSPVLLYDGTEKGNQAAHAAVFSMPLFDNDLQQCADSIIRMYGEYYWTVGAYDQLKFHLTNGFLMDYSSWRSGKRLLVNGNDVSWVQKSGYDDSYETFLNYLKHVMIYAGTLSLDDESTSVNIEELQAGDMFLKGGSPGHCVMVTDVAQDREGNYCFLLSQGYMPAQEFHVLKNPLHAHDPWYYISQLEYPFTTPEYIFQEGSFQRWQGFFSFR